MSEFKWEIELLPLEVPAVPPTAVVVERTDERTQQYVAMCPNEYKERTFADKLVKRHNETIALLEEEIEKMKKNSVCPCCYGHGIEGTTGIITSKEGKSIVGFVDSTCSVCKGTGRQYN